jgi:cell division protein FtsB
MFLVGRISRFLRRQWLTLSLTAACGLLAIDVVAGPLGLRDLIALRARRAQLEITHRELVKANAELKLQLDRLEHDDRYLERRIREELGYVHPDELVYRFATDTAPEDR